MKTILVFGANGTVGTELVRALRAKGENVRLATSKAPRASDEARVNLASGEGLKEAFSGVRKAFLLSPPGYADQHAILSPLVAEAKAHGLEKVVLMTAMGANAAETAPFRRAEIELERSGLTYNIIRPNWFMQNFNTFWAQGVREQGLIALPAGDAGTSFIDARDISAVAAELLTSDRHANSDFDLTGPEALTHAEAAQAIAAATGRAVRYQNIEPSALRQGLVAAGLPVAYVDFLIMIFGFLREGYNARVTDSVEKILGRKPGELAAYASDFKNSWKQ